MSEYEATGLLFVEFGGIEELIGGLIGLIKGPRWRRHGSGTTKHR